MLFRMLFIRFKNSKPIVKKIKKQIFRKSKIRNKIKTNRWIIKNYFLRTRAHTHTNTHTHTHTHAHTRTHTHARTHTQSIHTDIFQKQCILIPNTSENNYNMFLQQLKAKLYIAFGSNEGYERPRVSVFAGVHSLLYSLGV